MFSYDYLKGCWVRGFRNGNIRRLSRLQRAFYRACLIYARQVKRIVNRFLINQVKPLVEILTSSPRVEALRCGFKRALEVLRSRVLSWAPQVRRWLMDEPYLVYLGLMWMADLSYFKP